MPIIYKKNAREIFTKVFFLKYSIFLITLYCADNCAILSGYFVQWVINLTNTNITEFIDYISIQYEIDSNTSKYLIQI